MSTSTDSGTEPGTEPGPAPAEQATATAAAPAQAPAGLWGHRDFMSLWAGQTVSDAGSAITQLALPLVAVLALHATTLQVGLLTASTTIPFLLVALPAGPIVDRSLKRRLMLRCDIGRAILAASIPIAAAFGVLSMVQLCVVAVALGVLTVFFSVAYQSYLPSLVDRSQLVDANGKLGTTQSVAQLVGPSLGGLLVTLIGAASTITLDAGSYVVSALSLGAIRKPEQAPAVREGKRNLRAEIAEGLRFVIGHPILRRVVVATATSNFFGTITTALQSVYLVRVLHAQAWLIGLVMAASSIGGLLGGLASSTLSRKIGTARMIWLPSLLFGWCGLLIPAARPGWSVWLVAVGFAVLMVIAVVYNSAQVSYRQAICPPELLGRMNAAVRWIMWGTMPLGALVGGVLGTYVGIRPMLCVATLGDWAAVLFVFLSPLRKMRDIPQL